MNRAAGSTDVSFVPVDRQVNLVSKARQVLSQPVAESAPEYTFTLPDLSIHPPDFSEFLEKDLIEKCSLMSLEGAGRLNWWAEAEVCQKLWPLATTGDGNCLLHAASLGMWGFHDRLLTLRKALHNVLCTSSFTDAFYRRWRWQTCQQNEAAGLVLCEDEWQREWQTLLRMASTQPRVRPEGTGREMSGGKKAVATPDEEDQPHVYESLEELHILALAHVLRRPIIVVADTMLKDLTGEPFAPIPFGGIYLPIECRDECHKSPLCLTYDAAHFSALVAMDTETYADKTPQLPAAIPLTDADGKILPLQFAVDPGPDIVWTRGEDIKSQYETRKLDEDQKLSLLKKYMEIRVLEQKVKDSETQKGSEAVDKKLLEEEVVADVLEKANTLPARLDATTKSEDSRSFRRNLFHSLRRRFGSLRRSMSKSLRSNIGSLARRGTSFRLRQSLRLRSRKKNLVPKNDNEAADTTEEPKKNPVPRSGVICARLHTDRRHDYQEEMVRNYLTTARVRFLAAQKSKTSSPRTPALTPTVDSSSSEGTKGDSHYASQCVTTGCLNYGTAATSYLCSSCFADQKQEMNKCEKIFESRNEDVDLEQAETQTEESVAKSKLGADDLVTGETCGAVVQC